MGDYRVLLFMSKNFVKRVLPWLLLGPVTGLLAEGMVRNWRAGNVGLTWLYGLAFAMTTFGLFALDGRLIAAAASL